MHTNTRTRTQYETDQGTFYRDINGPSKTTTTKEELIRGIAAVDTADHLLFFLDLQDPLQNKERVERLQDKQQLKQRLDKRRQRKKKKKKKKKKLDTDYCLCAYPFQCDKFATPPKLTLPPAKNAIERSGVYKGRKEAISAWVQNAVTAVEKKKRSEFAAKENRAHEFGEHDITFPFAPPESVGYTHTFIMPRQEVSKDVPACLRQIQLYMLIAHTTAEIQIELYRNGGRRNERVRELQTQLRLHRLSLTLYHLPWRGGYI